MDTDETDETLRLCREILAILQNLRGDAAECLAILRQCQARLNATDEGKALDRDRRFTEAERSIDGVLTAVAHDP